MSEQALLAWATQQMAAHPELGKSVEEWKEHGRRMLGMAAMAHAQAAEGPRPGAPAGPRRPLPPDSRWTDKEYDEWVEDFLRKHDLDDRSRQMLREAEREHQEIVISRGSMADARNPTAVLIGRIRDAKAGILKAKGKGKGEEEKGKGKGADGKGRGPGDEGGKGKGKDGEDKGKGKGKGKGKDEDRPPPEKLFGENWEKPRSAIGLRLFGENSPPEHRWDYVLADDSRRCYAGYMRSPFSEAERTQFFDIIKDGTKWCQPEGRQGPIPRKTAWMVKQGCRCHYTYGSIQVDPQEFPPWMTELMRKVMPYCGLADEKGWPDSCNLNLYDDGGMSVGWHSDDESLFQGKFRDISIISLSFGVTRKFELRLNWPEPGERPVRRLLLGSGDLMTMEGMVQKHYQHRVPREENIQGPRINLTWRWNLKHRPQCPAGRSRLPSALPIQYFPLDDGRTPSFPPTNGNAAPAPPSNGNVVPPRQPAQPNGKAAPAPGLMPGPVRPQGQVVPPRVPGYVPKPVNIKPPGGAAADPSAPPGLGQSQGAAAAPEQASWAGSWQDASWQDSWEEDWDWDWDWGEEEEHWEEPAPPAVITPIMPARPKGQTIKPLARGPLPVGIRPMVPGKLPLTPGRTDAPPPGAPEGQEEAAEPEEQGEAEPPPGEEGPGPDPTGDEGPGPES